MKKRGRDVATGVLLVGCMLASACAVAEGRPAAPTVLTPTPYMGWDTYFAFGPRYSESTVLTQASALLSDGLARRGYRYVWLDVGWWQGKRDSHGEIVVDRGQWPHGMAWLAHTLHSAGLRVGLYTDAGIEGCGGKHDGSYGHYRQDADTFAAWGFDAVKVDFCGGVRMGLEPARAYSAFHAALQANSSHRPLLLSICNFLEPGQFQGEPPFAQSAFASYTFGPSAGNSWRTDTDVGSPGRVTFPTVLRNMDADAAHPEAAGPGHWNDPDYLGPDQGLTPAQFRTQLGMWAMLAAPLMVSDDLQAISSSNLAALKNPDVLAIDQDPAGVQGQLVSSSGEAQVWAKPLAGGARAVALLNRGSVPLRIQTSAAAVGVDDTTRYAVLDVWKRTRHSSSGPLSAVVGAESTVLLRVSPAGEAR
jgi:alpha-galactosidase